MPTGLERFEAALAERLGSGVKRVEQLLMAEKGRVLRDFELTVAQYAAMMALHFAPGQSAAQLARAALVSPQTMATILRNLEDKGLIERHASSVHAKVFVCELTPEGEALVLRADEVVRGVEADLASVFTVAEFERFQGFLARAEAHLRQRR